VISAGVLSYRRFRYLWAALALTAISLIIYVTQSHGRPARGDTWQGYTLGSIAALLVLWLAILGIRKRRYSSTMGSVQGWTSAHIYLGLALVVIATLHCAFDLHANIHTYAYLLMCGVVASGVLGVAFYSSLPRQQSVNRGGVTRKELFAALVELDAQITTLADHCEPEIAAAVKSSIDRTHVGGGVAAQLFGLDRSLFESPDIKASERHSNLVRNADQRPVLACVAARITQSYRASGTAAMQSLVVALARRQTLLRRIRRDIQLQGWLRIWLYVHVPLTLATIAALIVHIVSTFLYF
jgi:hypothetical protein